MKLKDLDPQKFEVPCGWYDNFDFSHKETERTEWTIML